MIRKLTCHCGGVEAQVEVPEIGFKKVMRCNCTLCKRKGYVIGVLGENDFEIIKGEKLLKLYQYYTKAAKHYFCSICGIHTHNRPRIVDWLLCHQQNLAKASEVGQLLLHQHYTK